MFVDGGWWDAKKAATSSYLDVCHQADLVEARKAAHLAAMITAYAWPAREPVATRPDGYRAIKIADSWYGEDLIGELAFAQHASTGAARHLATQIVTLTHLLPGCWTRIVTAQAPLWQAGKIADACIRVGLDTDQYEQVDATVAGQLGTLGYARLSDLVEAAITAADPDTAREYPPAGKPRQAHIGQDRDDRTAGYVCATLNVGDAIRLEETVQHLADLLTPSPAYRTLDARRACALGMLANPQAVADLLAGTPIPPDTWGTRAHVFVHLYAGSLDTPDELTNPDTLARVEQIGPMLAEQVATLTGATHVKLTPVLHLDHTGITADMYEIPDRIRRHILARDPYDMFPWSCIESRHLDLDHTTPYKPGIPGQTATGNLAPLTRTAHRLKTHAGFHLTQPTPGILQWTTPAGQHATGDHTGTHPIRQ
jgi:hypothetical protein